MNDESEKVVQIRSAEALPENLITADDKDRYSVCRHERITLDEHQRTVNCRGCGRVLDPFQFLQHESHLLQRAWANHDIAARKVTELSERISVLTKEYTSLKGKVARLREKMPTIDVRGKDRL